MIVQTEKRPWTLSNAKELCIRLERIAPKYGAHIALTGGTLYKEGERKDIDVLVYRIRQVDKIDVAGFLEEIYDEIGIFTLADYNWCIKAGINNKNFGSNIDFFFPERVDGPELRDYQ